MNEMTATEIHAGDPVTARIERAAQRVLGDSEAGTMVLTLCRSHAAARKRVLTDRVDDATVIAVVGATGQGKSWLVRQFVTEQVASVIPSGNELSEATEKLTWVGPQPPADMDTRHETYVACPRKQMHPMRSPYLLVDAPGATDDRHAIAEVAQRALSLASVLLLVIRRDQLRSMRVAGLAAMGEGTLLIPVVNAVRPDDVALEADAEALAARLRRAAPQSELMTPVIVSDFDLGTRAESEVGKAAVRSVVEQIEASEMQGAEGDHRRGSRLAAMDARFIAAVASSLQEQLPELTSAVARLNEEADRLPGEVAGSLLGGPEALRAAIRSRLRIGLLTDTAAIFFPYRTLLSLFNLTHGAWDRVLMSLSGSLPSLLGAVTSSVRNLGDQQAAMADVRDGLRQRTASAVADRLGPLARRFRDEVHAMHGARGAARAEHEPDQSTRAIATLAGIDSLQEASTNVFESTVKRGRVSTPTVWVASVIATGVFWLAMSGPLTALYRGYIDASLITLSSGDVTEAADLKKFPRPDASMLITSVLLSLLPTAIIAMVTLTFAQGRGRVRRVQEAVESGHLELVRQLQSDGVLHLSWTDPVLADAEFLLSIGQSYQSRSTS
ncbi:MAG: hypothetical protein AAGD07_11530 [Planctomycetota bacterium]